MSCCASNSQPIKLSAEYCTRGHIVRLSVTDCYPMDRDSWAVDGIIYTPGFPFQYTNYMGCTISINALSEANVTITVDKMDIENAGNCIFDRLMVRHILYNLSYEPSFSNVTQ